MKRIAFLLIPVLMLTVLVLAVAAEIPTEAGPPSAAQKLLEQYRSSFFDADTRVSLVTRAERPWNLTRDLGWPVLGDSVYFQTDRPIRWSRSEGPSPLPFPPKEAWCALLESEERTIVNSSYTVVLVGLHMDMYSGDWMIHQSPSDPLAVGEVLLALGCELGWSHLARP